jgi:hypothetical protein
LQHVFKVTVLFIYGFRLEFIGPKDFIRTFTEILAFLENDMLIKFSENMITAQVDRLKVEGF